MERRALLKLMSAAAISGCAHVEPEGDQPLKVVVVGAGVIGASIAYHLSKAGAKVVVIDQEAPASHASRGTFAWINATWAKQPRHYHALSQQGVSNWHTLEQELKLPVRWGGSLEWFSSQQRQTKLSAQIAEQVRWGEPARMVTTQEFAKLEPKVRFPRDWQAAFSPNDGAVDPVLAAQSFLAAAKKLGAEVRFPCRLESSSSQMGRLVSVKTSQGEIRANRLVLATGAAPGISSRFMGVDLPQRTTPGIITLTKPLASRIINRVIATEHVHLHQRDDGRVVIGESTSVWKNSAHSERLKDRPNNFPHSSFVQQHGSRMISKAASVLPELTSAEVEHAYIGWRPLPLDGHPVIGVSPVYPDVYVSVMHSGVSLAPIVGQVATQEIMQGIRLKGLAEYRPEREFSEIKRY